MSKVAELPLAVRVREFIVENPTLSNAELHELWEKKHGKIRQNVLRSGRSVLKKKFYGDLPLVNGQVSKAGIVRRILENNPDWSDNDIIEYMSAVGVEATRSCVSNARFMAKKNVGTQINEEVVDSKIDPEERGYRSKMVREFLSKNPDSSPKDVVKALAKKRVTVSLGLVSVIKYSKKRNGISPDKNQNAGPRARRMEGDATVGSYDDIEQRLDELIQAADSLGNSALANSIRHSRRMASAAIVSQS